MISLGAMAARDCWCTVACSWVRGGGGRFVTHLGIDDDQADALVESFTRFFAGR